MARKTDGISHCLCRIYELIHCWKTAFLYRAVMHWNADQSNEILDIISKIDFIFQESSDTRDVGLNNEGVLTKNSLLVSWNR